MSRLSLFVALLALTVPVAAQTVIPIPVELQPAYHGKVDQWTIPAGCTVRFEGTEIGLGTGETYLCLSLVDNKGVALADTIIFYAAMYHPEPIQDFSLPLQIPWAAAGIPFAAQLYHLDDVEGVYYSNVHVFNVLP